MQRGFQRKGVEHLHEPRLVSALLHRSQITKSRLYRRLLMGTNRTDFPRLRDEDSSANSWIWPSSAMLLALPAISTFAFRCCYDVCCWREKCVCRFQSRDPSGMSCALPVRCWNEKKQIAKSCVRDSRPRVRLCSGARNGLRCDSDCASASICLSVSCCACRSMRCALWI